MIPSTGKKSSKGAEVEKKFKPKFFQQRVQDAFAPRCQPPGKSRIIGTAMYGIEAAASWSPAGFHNQFWISSQFSQMLILSEF